MKTLQPPRSVAADVDIRIGSGVSISLVMTRVRIDCAWSLSMRCSEQILKTSMACFVHRRIDEVKLRQHCERESWRQMDKERHRKEKVSVILKGNEVCERALFVQGRMDSIQ